MATYLPAAVEAEDTWIDDVDLNPQGAWLRMGTRNLGARPWLVVDGKRPTELGLKDQLLHERFDEVFAATDGSEAAGTEVLELVGSALATLTDVADTVVGNSLSDRGRRLPESLHPLDEAGRLVQEDLCLLRPTDAGTWVMAAASLCFPSRWRLATKMGHGLNAVHGPVPGYDPTLNSRVDSLMTGLASRLPSGEVSATDAGPGDDGGRVVWRRNWFIHPDASLFQPDRPSTDPVVAADDCLDGLHLRSERQTLRALTRSGWVLFAIRTQQASLRTVAATKARRAALISYVSGAPTDLLEHRGVCSRQRHELLQALGER